MNVTVEFLSLPNIVKAAGGKVITVNFSGLTVGELIQDVADRLGKEVREFLFDENGRLDMGMAVTLNKKEWIRSNQMDRALQDGDRITIMMMAAGG